MRKHSLTLLNIALAAALLGFISLADVTYEKPGRDHLACTDYRGRLTTGADWKECHRARNLLSVLARGW